MTRLIATFATFAALAAAPTPVSAPAAPGPAAARPDTIPTAAAVPGDDTAAALEQGRRLTRWLQGGQADSIVARLAPSYRAQLGGPDAVRRAVAGIRAQLGEEQAVVQETAFTRTRTDHYYRIARFSGAPGRTVTVHWAWNDAGAVRFLQVQPTPEPASTRHDDYRTRTDLRLPFDGTWYVFWGGREAYQNYHVPAPTQRFAYDFVVLENGATHTGSGTSNADYHCFGRPVLAPAPGRVVTAVDTVPENVPGAMNDAVPAGNHVIIDHGNSEYSLLAHLRHGSVTVEPGDSVDRGQRIGACGNTGRSSEPHVHYHLQTGSAFGEGAGLPAQFQEYEVDGRAVERGEPVRGQLISGL